MTVWLFFFPAFLIWQIAVVFFFLATYSGSNKLTGSIMAGRTGISLPYGQAETINSLLSRTLIKCSTRSWPAIITPS